MAAKIRAVYDGLNPDSAEGNYVKDMVDAVEQLQNLFTEALVEASENYQAADSEQKNTARDGSVQHQEREKGAFTPSEIQAIQSIGRKSINSFTSADIKATEKFARRYWKEMGEKSPFLKQKEKPISY